MSASLEPVDAAQAGIQRYLYRHPEACDTIAGIHRWWLAGERNGLGPLEVRAAVERLLRSGQMQRRRLPDGSEVYAGSRGPI